jgi:isoquinoline 1-oxidoreductase beta subunit
VSFSATQAALTPYVRIDQSGISIFAPRAEMGQGVHTTLAALVAEELDVSLENIAVEHGPASSAYYNGLVLEEGLWWSALDTSAAAENARAFSHVPAKFLGMQITGGSTSTPDAYVKMRKAGAAARAVLLEAAAEQLAQNVDSLRTENGFVIAADDTRIPYTSLAEKAAEIEPPDDPVLKSRPDWKLLGKSQPRVDMHDKCTGDATYSIDVQLPDMLYATVRMNPHLGGAMRSYDA